MGSLLYHSKHSEDSGRSGHCDDSTPSKRSEESVERLPNSRGCFVCGLENPYGFKLGLYREADTIFADLSIPERYRGYDGVAHGGVVAMLLDDIMGWAANCAAGGATATGELRIRYRQPTPVNEPLRLEARVVKARAALYYVEGTLQRADGMVCATGSAKLLAKAEGAFDAGSYDLIYAPGAARLFDRA
jgi:acyl-coenzyme A thioesterase PaaI-like protein